MLVNVDSYKISVYKTFSVPIVKAMSALQKVGTCLVLRLVSIDTNLRRLHWSKNNHQKIIVIGQIIGSGQIDSFM